MVPKEVLDVCKERFDIKKLTCVAVKKTETEGATAFIRKLYNVRSAVLKIVKKRTGEYRGALYKIPKIATVEEAYAIRDGCE